MRKNMIEFFLNEVIKRANKYGVKFNKSKVQYKISEVRYVGHVFSSEGVRPNPEYIKAVLALEEPKNKKELLRILGMVNYLSKYLPKLSEVLSPLRNLIKKDVEWLWTKDHAFIFSKIKTMITEIPILKIFDPKIPIEIQTDASQKGIGGCLLQAGRPVAFCSRSLTETECKWAQIEKEYLAISFSLQKFHHFIYGRKILVKSDHKPLVSINKKDICKISSRLQRLKLKMLKYNYKIEYLPGKYMYIADLLSRSFLKHPVKDDVEMKEVIHSVHVDLPISRERLNELKTATENDSVLAQILKFCENGWPKK